jgi:glucose/arabinose dehydrogenase
VGAMNRFLAKSSVAMGLTITIVALFMSPGGSGSTAVAAGPLLPVDITVEEVIASGFEHPVHLTHAGDGSGRMFVVEQQGIIRIIKGGSVLPAPFLDITGKVLHGGERGLLSVAFPPDYASKEYFYVNYTRQPDGNTVVARYRVTGDPDVAEESSEEVLLTVSQPYGNHNGGQLVFGPRDGYLYIGMGDGGSGGDPQNRAQNTSSLLGKILRIDVESGVAPYRVPSDNPFVDAGEHRDEIWALGLRNPWRFSFDRSTTDAYIGDVGQNAWEEIDYESADSAGGLNFGWRCKEGMHDFSGDCPSLPLTDPIAEYGRSDGSSVTGGFVYRGIRYPALAGRYFYADYVSGKIWSMYKTGLDPTTWSAPELELDTNLYISSFGEDEEGEVYIVDHAGGTVRRLADVDGPSD